jgi:Leucine-rich repeat (LRR) protein
MNTSITIRPVTGRVNPSPRLVADMANEQAERDLQKILDGIIGEEFLRNTTNQEDLSLVVELRIKVNSSYQSLLDLKTLLPNLSTLKLDASTIVSIRDLGVGLRQLQTLSLNSCGLTDLDGMGVLTGLRKLSLCDNFINDMAPLAMHENIKVR